MFYWDFKAFLMPNPFDSFMVDSSPIHAHKVRNCSIPIAAIYCSVIDYRFADKNIVFSTRRLVPLRAAILPEN